MAKYSKGKIDETKEPFSVRKKEFWDVADTYKLTEEKFKKMLAHEPDGLIFQPSRTPYKCGRDDTVLKWKPASMNSVDFRLKIMEESGRGIVTRTRFCRASLEELNHGRTYEDDWQIVIICHISFCLFS